MSAMGSELNIVERTDAYCVAQVSNVSVVVWNRAPSESGLDAVHVRLMKAAADNPDKMGMLLIARTKQSPVEGANKKAAAAMRELGLRLKAVAVVTGGSDFWSKVVRVSLHAILGVVRATGSGPQEAAFFATPTEAAKWLGDVLEKQHIQGATSSQLVAAMERLEKAFPPPPPSVRA
ncbi:MAG: hypothetical protein QM765_21760 [Myxococcales bacterium]